jgi:hypothetical protein
MAGRNVITREALRPNDRTQNVGNGAARLAKHQARVRNSLCRILTICQIRTFEACLSAETLRASRISCREARLGNWQGAGPTAQPVNSSSTGFVITGWLTGSIVQFMPTPHGLEGLPTLRLLLPSQ